MSEEKMIKRGITIGGIVLAVLIVFLLCTTKIPTGHTGVVTTFGRVENVTLDSGLHLKAPWQSVIKMDNRVQKKSTDLECFSRDIQEVKMLYTLNYQISKADAMKIYANIGRDYYNTIIIPLISEAAKTMTAKYTAEELITNRTELAMSIESTLAENLKDYNILLVSTSIENIDFTDAFTDAVEAKQVAQQNKLRTQTEADTKVIQANADAQVRKIEADAEAYVNTTVSESLTPEILQKMYYEKWNGVLPSVLTGDSSNLLLDLNK